MLWFELDPSLVEKLRQLNEKIKKQIDEANKKARKKFTSS